MPTRSSLVMQCDGGRVRCNATQTNPRTGSGKSASMSNELGAREGKTGEHGACETQFHCATHNKLTPICASPRPAVTWCAKSANTPSRRCSVYGAYGQRRNECTVYHLDRYRHFPKAWPAAPLVLLTHECHPTRGVIIPQPIDNAAARNS